MKTFLISLTLSCLAILSGCDKNKDTNPLERPITGFVKDTTSIATGTWSTGPWELGIVFSFLVAGKISQLGS